MAAKQGQLYLHITFLSFLIIPLLAFPLERGKSLDIIRKINKMGLFLGLITVYTPEENAFFAHGAFKNDSKYPYVDLSGRRFRVGRIEGKSVTYVRCGVELVNAATVTQQMLDLFNIKGLIHFGISGNTNSSLSIGDVTIPKEFANTGLWDWLKTNATIPSNDVAKLDFENYNVPKGGNSLLGCIGYSPEQFYSEAGDSNVAQEMLWFQGMELEQCVNSSLCLENKPKVVVGLKGSTANTFLDNASYRDFLFQTFGVSSADVESTAVVMTSLSSGYPIIVVRGLSDLAGGQDGQNSIRLFGSLAAANVAKVVVQFIKLLPNKSHFPLYDF